MKNDTLPRRRLLTLSSAGLITTAGCTENVYEGFQPDDGRSETNKVTEGGPRNQPPQDPAVSFKRNQNAITDYRLPFYEGWDSVQYSEHPDTRIASVEVDSTEITVNIGSMKVNRDIEFSAAYLRHDGSVGMTDSVTVSSESDNYESHEITLPVNSRELPREKKGVVKILIEDTAEHSQGYGVLKEHRFIAIPFENSRTSGVRWVNDERLNFNYVGDPISKPDRLYTVRDGFGEQYTRFFVLAHPVRKGRLISGYSNINRDMYHEYQDNKDNLDWFEDRHPGSYIYNADDFEMFTSLTNSFTDSLDANNITSKFDRLQQLAFLVGSMEYQLDRIKDNQVKTLAVAGGDCTEVTTLYLALMNTTAFDNTQGAMIHCELADLGGHAIIGIDEQHLGTPPNPDALTWHYPDDDRLSDGVPDTRYALTELTQPRRIGNFDDEKNKIVAIMDTTNLDVTPQLRDF
ncbi:hypothetical protein [Natrinema salifodinae]|uniref:Uncharacterized protein n=1 Tax=Natrinema salifodinae TaxID=1202768 RepID=A0A1I0QC60_9EURY|nr:hypothetical protein [Natrinema salifodinae]SEW24457.1 hypothetical protein SAMN05216285_3352 [Natrinema salifodinae]